MATRPKALGEAQTADSESEVLESTARQAGTIPESGPSQATSEARPEGPTERGDEFDALVGEIRSWLGWESAALPYLEDQIRRRLGVAPLSAAAMVLTGLVGVALRLAVALVATAVFGQWAGIPWGRWAVILAIFAVFDAGRPFIGPPPDVPSGPRVRRTLEDWTSLLPTIVRESDLRDLAEFIRRWNRPLMSTAMGVAVAAIMLTAGWLFAPDALSELPVGTTVLLALLLFEFGASIIYLGVVFQWVFMAREAKYDHYLFWLSPSDSPEVHKAMRKATAQGSAAGMWITVLLVVTVVLVSWDSQLVVPLGAGFIVIGYFATFGMALKWRSSVQKIVQSVREQRLRGLRDRIDGFGPRYRDLSPEESQELRDLAFLHDKIRDAPTTPTHAHTVARTAAGLIVPTIVFVITVFGEVTAERFLDAILP